MARWHIYGATIEAAVANCRIVRRIGSGYMAGSYVSAPSNVTSFTSYGNTISIGRANQARMEALRAAARARPRAR